MNEKLMECFLNPVKLKIFFEIEKHGTITAKELSQKDLDIPQATLYRHLKKMLEDGLIRVVEERKVRNVIEKIYEVVPDFRSDVEKIVTENDGIGYLGLFQQFIMALSREFEDYAKRADINIQEDGSGFRMLPFYATAEELQDLAVKMNEVIMPYYELEQTPERKLRNVGIIYTPPKK